MMYKVIATVLMLTCTQSSSSTEATNPTPIKTYPEKRILIDCIKHYNRDVNCQVRQLALRAAPKIATKKLGSTDESDALWEGVNELLILDDRSAYVTVLTQKLLGKCSR